MADKKPQEEKEKFEVEVYKLGLELIEAFREGKCHDRKITLETIIAIFRREGGK